MGSQYREAFFSRADDQNMFFGLLDLAPHPKLGVARRELLDAPRFLVVIQKEIYPAVKILCGKNQRRREAINLAAAALEIINDPAFKRLQRIDWELRRNQT